MVNGLHTIVLTDDDEDDREFFTSAVQSTHPHIKLLIFNDGVGLKDYLKDKPAEKPQLIFLDINMPRLNGFQVLESIRKEYSPDEMPVIMYTTSSSETDIDLAQKLGANMFFRKPNDFKILKHLVGKVLSMDWSSDRSGEEFII